MALLCALASGAAVDGSPQAALAQLDRAEALWRSRAPASYSFTVEYSAFLGEYGCFSQSYVVKGIHSTGMAPDDCEYRPDKLGTVRALFKLMRQSLRGRGHWDEATVEFDETLGYPKTFYVGDKDVIDDYFQFQISRFEVTPNTSLERTRER